MNTIDVEEYDIKGRLTSPVFLCWVPFLFYVDFMRKAGFGRNPYDFGFYSYYWEKATFPLLITILYGAMLFHFSKKIEGRINPQFKKLQPLVYSIILTFMVVANSVMFGGSNSTFILKLGLVCSIGTMLFLKQMFSPNEAYQKVG